ncbi:hypothetical protein B7494_g7367 [Chlorociboria aeruginascens]|nr:hypothetical protein B7494_g7367 [Chlorociboria aeruginascens]
MTSESHTVRALLLPADGSKIRIVNYNIKEKDDQDVVDSGMADFYDPIPDLKSWFGNAYQDRAMTAFHVDVKRRKNCDPIGRAFITSEEPTAYGQYCLYYTLSLALPINKSCERIVGRPFPGQLFWRGNIVVVRYNHHLGLGHLYKDVEEVAIKAVEEVLRNVYKNHGLERVYEDNGQFIV